MSAMRSFRISSMRLSFCPPYGALVRYREVAAELVPYLDTWDKSFLNWGSSADLSEPWPTAPQGVTYLKLTRFDDSVSGDVIKPKGERFRGKLIVLIIQTHHLGTLMGQPTGGSQ